METNRMEIQIGDHILTATLVENSSTDALKAALSEGPITIDMRDYGSMEKVGSLGMDLPRNDEQITTEAGPVNFSALFKQITCLALLITADPERGAIVTDEDVAELRKSISHLQVKHIPGAGHSIRREQFSKYMESVNTFIAETR
jgi:hypothetical protein